MTRQITQSKGRLALATGAALALMGTGIATAHISATSGSTAADPGSGSRGSTVSVSASGVSTAGNSSWGLVFADPNYVTSFRDGSSRESASVHGEGDAAACAHGQPIAGPVSPDASGDISAVDVSVPYWASPGRALLCFSNGTDVSEPVEFEVTGGFGR